MTSECKVDHSRLSALARDFAQRLFEVYPEWERYASVQVCNESSMPERDSHGDLVVIVPPPTGVASALSLLIETDYLGDEVTVYYDHFHDHFSWPPGGPPYEDWGVELLNQPLTLIRAILDEELAFKTDFTDDKPAGSTYLRRQDVPPLRQRQLPSRHRVRIRSWRGTLDRDY